MLYIVIPSTSISPRSRKMLPIPIDLISDEMALFTEDYIDATWEEMLDTPFSFWHSDQSFTVPTCAYCQTRPCDC